MTAVVSDGNGGFALKKSTQVAIGGLSAAICLLLMFMTGMIPLSSYILPAMAGIVLIGVGQESGAKTALLVYAVTSLLGLMIVPDREAILLFIMLLGYYPILRPHLQRLPKFVSLILKLGLLNIVILAFYLLLKYVFAIPDMAKTFRVGAAIFLLIVNFTFLMYDFLISQLLVLYTKWFRPKILRKLL